MELSNYKNNKKIIINFIGDVYRLELVKLLNKYNKNDSLNIIETFFYTSIFNEDIIEQNPSLFKSNQDVIVLKKFLTRIILSDAFIKACSIKYDYEEKGLSEEELFDLDDDDKDMTGVELDIANSVYDYFQDMSKISFPRYEDLRFNIYALFLDYNSEDKTYDFRNFENDSDNVKKLKKINPLYIFDNRRL